MNVADLKVSKYLKKEDVGEGLLLTITAVLPEQNVGMEDKPDMKVCLKFKEHDKPLVLNITNGGIIWDFLGIHDDIETGWLGKQVVLYNDPTIMYAGKRVGGIRARAPKEASEVLPF